MIHQKKIWFCVLFLILTIGYSSHEAQAAEVLPVKPSIVRPVKPIKKLSEKVEKEIEEKAKLTQTMKSTEVASEPIKQTLESASELHTQLPVTLDIVNKAGEVVFSEITVEDGWRAIKNQWLLLLKPEERKYLTAMEAHITSEKTMPSLGLSLVQFTLPDALDSYQAISQQLPQHLLEKLGRNHIYDASVKQDTAKRDVQPQNPSKKKLICDNPLRIGMIDTAIDTQHLAFKNSKIRQKQFIQQDIELPNAHGTAVAGLIVGQYDALQSSIPHAELFAASVFYSRNQVSQGATLMHLIKALDWLVASKVKVINMSLTGPDNPVLATAVNKVINQQVVIVAAAGNDGPTAGPRYPAAYDKVIAVTAVDKEKQIYRWANQGDYIDFASYGVSVVTARKNNQLGRETGTSMAAPQVTALSACLSHSSNSKISDVVRQQLKNRAEDLGIKGKDTVFGDGFLAPNELNSAAQN